MLAFVEPNTEVPLLPPRELLDDFLITDDDERCCEGGSIA
jgi:hypothetical protein